MTDRNTIARRQVLKVLGAAASTPLLACNDTGTPAAAPSTESLAAGTPSDPDLINPTVPWEPILTAEEMRTVSVLCDIIIPADDRSPSASEVGVPAFINEWVSAPFRSQQEDLVVIRGGLVWLDTEAGERFEARFIELTPDQQHAICDDIKYTKTASPEYAGGAAFFRLFRNLTATGFYTTREGMADLQYIGNQALPRFDGPPAEVLRYLGLS